jgi:hypothetical protein
MPHLPKICKVIFDFCASLDNFDLSTKVSVLRMYLRVMTDIRAHLVSSTFR